MSVYAGVFAPHVPLILRLAGEGKSPQEIARLVPWEGRYWLRPHEMRPISPELVVYILRRSRGLDPISARLWSDGQRRDFVEFRRRYEAWEADRRGRPIAEAFEAYCAGLSAALGWLIGELEARKEAGG